MVLAEVSAEAIDVNSDDEDLDLFLKQAKRSVKSASKSNRVSFWDSPCEKESEIVITSIHPYSHELLNGLPYFKDSSKIKINYCWHVFDSSLLLR